MDNNNSESSGGNSNVKWYRAPWAITAMIGAVATIAAAIIGLAGTPSSPDKPPEARAADVPSSTSPTLSTPVGSEEGSPESTRVDSTDLSGSETAYLSNLEMVDSNFGDKGPATIKGKSYANSVIIDPSDPYSTPYASYDMGGHYTRFKATVGMLSDDKEDYPVRYEVFTDGKSRAKGLVTLTKAKELDIDVTGVQRLKLTASVTSDEQYYGQIYRIAYGDAVVMPNPSNPPTDATQEP